LSAAREPRLMRWIAQALLPAHDAEFILGDLAEEFQRVAAEDGVAAARRWYRTQALRTVGRSLARGGRAPLEAYARDVRHGLRSLLASPTYTVATVCTLALGVGGIVAVAALARSVLRPLPFPEPDRLVAVWETLDGRERGSAAPANYLDWRRGSDAFEGLAAHRTQSASITVDGTATRGVVAMVSGNFFDVLGAGASLGRTFDPSLDSSFADLLAVISHAAWREAFGSDPDVLGRTFRVDDVTYEVVGVAEPGLSFPDATPFAWLRSRTEAPEIAGFSGDLPTLRDAWYFQVLGRLAAGTTPEAASAELNGIARRLAQAYPDSNEGRGVELVPLLDQTVGGFGQTLLALAMIVGLVLLAATANVTQLTLARGAARSHDVAVKLALGASRADIRRGLLVEGWMLGLGASALGVGLARLALAAGSGPLGSWVPRSWEVGLRGEMASLGVALGLLVGSYVAATAYVQSRARSAETGWLRSGASVRGGRGQWMIAGQVAVALALLSGTLLLGRSVRRLASVDLGFAETGLVSFRVANPDARARPYEERLSVLGTITAAVAGVPGVESVGVGSQSPLGWGPRAGVQRVGQVPGARPPGSGWQPVDLGFMPALGMSPLAGRLLDEADAVGAVDVAVVNEAFVASVLGGEEAIGQQVTMGLEGHDRPLTIVGVVPDTRTRGPALPPGAVLYRPMRQTDSFGATAVFVVARVSGDEAATLSRIRTAVREAAPGFPVYSEAIGAELARPFRRAQTALLAIVTVFATTSLLLGAVGIYGVAAYGVRRRRREIGVRLALGADGRAVVREIVGRGMRTTALGVAVGLGLSLLLSRSMTSVLFEVRAGDPLSLVLGAAVVLLVTAAALYLPGRAAASVDPTDAIREA
jgi:putative ABC transport system permease protein